MIQYIQDILLVEVGVVVVGCYKFRGDVPARDSESLVESLWSFVLLLLVCTE